MEPSGRVPPSMCLPNTVTKYFLSDIPSSCFSKASCLPHSLVDLLEKKGIRPWQRKGGVTMEQESRGYHLPEEQHERGNMDH